MTKKELLLQKEILLRDLCGRLPYGVKIQTPNFDIPQLLQVIEDYDDIYINDYSSPITIEQIKPYLRPMSSMTEEEKKELGNYISTEAIVSRGGLYDVLRAQRHTTNYLYSRHLDVLGLIEEGLALEAPEGMYEI